MWIQREISEKIKQIIATRPALVLTGARQVGKSSLLKKLFPDYHYVTLDLPSVAAQAQFEPELFLKNNPPPVIIDEVQYAPELFRFLKIKIDENRDLNGQFILTGSQKFQLMKEVSDSLAGRVHVMELEGLSYFEISGHYNWPVDYAYAILRGGYPELAKQPELKCDDYFSSYTASYLERDVKDILNVSSLRDFERFMRLCAIRSSQMLNKSEIARDTGISPSTAGEWINILVTSGIIKLLEPWYSNKSKSIVKTPKLYFSDTGLLCFLLNIRTKEELINYAQVGALWETFVLSEIRKRLMIKGHGQEIYYWRDRVKEVDVVIPQAGKFILAEIKWTEFPTDKDCQGLTYAKDFLGSENIKTQNIICRSNEDFLKGQVQVTSALKLKNLL
jgi:uncharacterized protein